MKSFLEKIKSRVHIINNKIKLNPKIQYSLYAIAVFIIITIILSLIIAPLFTSKDFVRYKTKECFKKHDSDITSASEVNYAIVGDDLFMYYNFEQRCYKNLEIEHTILNNNVDITIKTNDINNGECVCLSEVTAKMGPLVKGEYVVNIIKDADGDKYNINSKNFTID